MVVRQGRQKLKFELIWSEKLEQIFFLKFFAWTRLNEPLASQKTIYGYKDLEIWFSTNRTFDLGRWFSPSVDFEASGDHYNVLRSCLLHLNVLREFNILSKSGLGIKIGQPCAEIKPIFHQKTSEITIFQKNRKFSKFYIFTFFWLKSSN
jgi:hypothetical protein